MGPAYHHLMDRLSLREREGYSFVVSTSSQRFFDWSVYRSDAREGFVGRFGRTQSRYLEYDIVCIIMVIPYNTTTTRRTATSCHRVSHFLDLVL
jgi:hypothetical protein